MAQSSSLIDSKAIAECVEKFRSRQPHVHCITNSVAQHFTANVLLAAGGKPSMTIAANEVGAFVEMSDAVLINLGTMDAERTKAVNLAVRTANQTRKPWVLDPVFVQASPGRLQLASVLLDQNPTVVRCNAREGRALLGVEPDAGLMQKKARELSTTIAWTGSSDVICNAQGIQRVNNGSAVMDSITTMGCALSAIVVGFMAIEANKLLAVTSAIAFFGLAGDVAEREANGPGTFSPYFLDALYNLSKKEIETGIRLS